MIFSLMSSLYVYVFFIGLSKDLSLCPTGGTFLFGSFFIFVRPMRGLLSRCGERKLRSAMIDANVVRWEEGCL